MELVIICLCPLMCLLLLFLVKKKSIFSLITVLATLAVIAIEVASALTSSDFHVAAFAFQLFIPAQLIALALTLIIGNVVITVRNKRREEDRETNLLDK